MKIKSQFKDYYDYVAHIYGGGDPMITYDRTRIGKYTFRGGMQGVEPVFVEDFKMERLIPIGSHIDDTWNNEVGFEWLIVCGKPFPLIKVSDDYPGKWEVFVKAKHDHLIKMYHREPTPVGIENADLVRLSKLVGHPVFIIHPRDFRRTGCTVIVDGNCPILSDYGLASVYPAEQLYQDLSYFLVNTMKDSPDTMPHTVLDNKSKIEQHGFDLKQSFRHRK